ncbi:hypothetical protein [Methylococcus geothermalis]|uniref:Transmembrane protein n=1 Tax=Methylococcus geothermalis TaxID=2681310 RepID=A0A858Q930_9GAMM|nr:hypothetical protein [Methylococcus geothermalis]QJD30337.1 hypothetical protein GNH96_10370 [Methylococcus geothermalis]
MKDKRGFSRKATLPLPAEPNESAHPASALLPTNRDEALSRIGKLPRDIGWMLLGGGLLSEVVMGLPPFWVLGILILYPPIGVPLAGFMERRAPGLLAGSLDFVHRYLDDLERRYPKR